LLWLAFLLDLIKRRPFSKIKNKRKLTSAISEPVSDQFLLITRRGLISGIGIGIFESGNRKVTRESRDKIMPDMFKKFNFDVQVDLSEDWSQIKYQIKSDTSVVNPYGSDKEALLTERDRRLQL